MPRKKTVKLGSVETGATVFAPPAAPTPAPAITVGKPRITKVKYSPGHMLVEYEIPRDTGDPDECTFACSEEAAESSSGPRTIRGAVISAWKNLQGGAQGANLNTPHRPEEPYVGGEDADPGALDLCLSPKCATIIDDLLGLAEAYLQGERLQPALPGMDNKRLAAGEKAEVGA
jgi:hypothetical protein